MNYFKFAAGKFTWIYLYINPIIISNNEILFSDKWRV